MTRSPFLLLFVMLLSYSGGGIQPFEPEEIDESEQLLVVTDVYGRKYPSLDPLVIYCGPGWGAKMFHFLYKHDGTIWADTDNYYSDFSDITFSNFWDPYFISFLQADSVTSYCKGWKLGETTVDGITWNIDLTKDQEDALWFDYDFYGSGTEIQYTISYRYEVIDGLLHFSSSDGQEFVFHPSERTYAKELIEAGEIIVLEGCMFY